MGRLVLADAIGFFGLFLAHNIGFARFFTALFNQAFGGVARIAIGRGDAGAGGFGGFARAGRCRVERVGSTFAQTVKIFGYFIGHDILPLDHIFIG
ncbi:hypothetical protein DMP17_04300 [Pseudonocardia sp. TMWB2A]